MSNGMNFDKLVMRDVFLKNILQSMERNKDIFFVTADFGSPVLDDIRAKYPDRFLNVGIAEQNLINISCGLALEGYRVFAYAIAPFITMRCYEQIRINLALLSNVRPLNVTLIGVGAGYSYVVSGPTHQCYEDISIMRSLPNINIYSPSDSSQTDSVYHHVISQNGINYVRLDAQFLPLLSKVKSNTNIGYRKVASGNDVLMISTGYCSHTALEISEYFSKINKPITIIDLFDLRNFNERSLLAIIRKYKFIFSIEEGFVGRGGLDSIIFNLTKNLDVKYFNFGVNPEYLFEIGSRREIHEKVGIGTKNIIKKIKALI
jgi:transketolase